MRIGIAADSRGHIPIQYKKTWVDSLSAELRKQGHTVDSAFGWEGTFMKAGKIRLCTLYSVVKELADKRRKSGLTKFNILICQFGIHDRVLPWNRIVWKIMIPKGKFDEKFFKQDDFFLTSKSNFSGKIGFYEDMKMTREYFRKIREYTDSIFLVGMHSWIDNPDQSRRYLHPRILKMNHLYSSFSDLYVDMPMNFSWTKTKLSKAKGDHTHYDKRGHGLVRDVLNNAIGNHNRTIPDLLNNFTKTICVDDVELTGDKFRKSIDDAGRFIASNTNERDIVLIAKRTSVQQISSFLGAIVYNRVPVIIQHPSSKVHLESFDSKMNKISKVLDVSLCICDEDHYESFNKFFNTEYIISKAKRHCPKSPCDPNDIAFIQLSSGTTSLPKIMGVSHRDLINHCTIYSQITKLRDGSSIVSWLPLYHDMGMIACFMLPIIRNVTFVHIDPFKWLVKPKSLFENIYKYKGTHVWLPNFAFSYLAKRVNIDSIPKKYLKSLTQCISCSEMAQIDDIQKFRKKFLGCGLGQDAIKVCYALAENVFAASQSLEVNHMRKNGRKIVSCGRPIPGTSIVIVRDGKDATEHQDGQVYIKSLYMPVEGSNDFHGYYNTGDRGFFENGELFILGREDDMIISHGDNVFPYDVEKSAESLDSIIDGRVACFGRFNDSLGTNDIVVCAESDDTSEDLKSSIMAQVYHDTGLSVTACVKPRGWLVKTSSGKLGRRETARKYKNELKS